MLKKIWRAIKKATIVFVGLIAYPFLVAAHEIVIGFKAGIA